MNNKAMHRPDIDGLRAVAVLSVIAFHAFPGALPGGFVGVDIFFVISGFLISNIIFEGMIRKDFSFLNFYARRIRRIFPALILVLAACYLFGWMTLLSDEFEQMATHMAAAIGFIQNFVFFSEAGYFDTDAALKPLLHLWSLAIEEQFYLVFPLLVWLTWRTPYRMFLIIFALFLLSFFLNIDSVTPDPAYAFFLPQTRVWELLTGSILACIQQSQSLEADSKTRGATFAFLRDFFNCKQNQKISDYMSVIGFALIVVSIASLDSHKQFPGWWALGPVAGSFLQIAAGPGAIVNRTFLSHQWMVFTGLLSYPLYLWHWPILSFLQILLSGDPTPGVRSAALVLSFVLAWITYRFVERPIREGQKNGIKVILLCTGAVAVACMGLQPALFGSLASREVVQINTPLTVNPVSTRLPNVIAGCGLGTNDEKRFNQCKQDGRGTARFALLGDSKAAALAPGIFLESTPGNYWMVMGGTNASLNAPVPVISNLPQYARFQGLAHIALDTLAANRNIDVVVITVATRTLFQLRNENTIEDLPASQNFDPVFLGLDIAIRQLVDAGKKVVITIDNPTLKDPKQCISRVSAVSYLNAILQLAPDRAPCFIAYDKHLELSSQYRKLLAQLQARYPADVLIFDPLDVLCDMKKRVCSSFRDDALLYSYSDHISEQASVLIAKWLVPAVEAFARQDGSKVRGK